MMTTIQSLAETIHKADKIAVMTGAGISTASGIPDFRSKGGIYDNKELQVERILSESYYYAQPKSFWTYFKQIFHFNAMGGYEPNLGHIWLKELEDAGKQVTVITQNVDGLHRKAGSSAVLEVHGTLTSAFCPKCRREYDYPYLLREEVPRCEKDGFILKSDVVLFEGRVKHMEEAYAAACSSDLFLVLGSSLTVYPLKELPRYASGESGIATAIVNRDATDMDHLFQYVIHDDIVAVFEEMKLLSAHF